MEHLVMQIVQVLFALVLRYIYIYEISVAGPVKGGVLETLFVVLTELKNNQKRRWMIHRTQCEQFSFEL